MEHVNIFNDTGNKAAARFLCNDYQTVVDIFNSQNNEKYEERFNGLLFTR